MAEIIDRMELSHNQRVGLDEYGWLSIVQRSAIQQRGWGLALIRFDAAAPLRLLELLKIHEEWLVCERNGLVP